MTSTETNPQFLEDLTGLPAGPNTDELKADAESLCGPDDLQDVEGYDGTLGVTQEFARRAAPAVCRITWKSDLSAYRDRGNVAGAAFGTGTLVAPNLIVTAAHLFEEAKGWKFPKDNATGATISPSEVSGNMVAEFGYQRDPQGNLRNPLIIPIRGMVIERPSGIDAAIVQLERSPGERFDWIEVTERTPQDGEAITIIQHPAGDPKKIESGTIGLIGNERFGYGDLDTMGGSSGSAVLDRLGRLIGIHVAGACDDEDIRRNFAVRIDTVLKASVDFRESTARSRRLDLDARERIVVTWAADPDRNGYDNVALATLAADGRVEKSTPAFNPRVNGHQLVPRVACGRNGLPIIAWADDDDENDFYNIKVAVGERDHTVAEGPLLAHTNGSGQQLAPTIGAATNGDFVVAWQDDADRNGFYNVYMRGFNADGSERFATRAVHTEGAGQQLRPEIAVAKHGAATVVVWEDDLDRNGELSVRARRFASTGRPLGDDIAVNTRTSFHQHGPCVAIAPKGGLFVVAWEDDTDNNRFYNVHVKAYRMTTGSVALNERIAHVAGAGQQRRPSVAVNDNGNIAIAWEDDADRNGYTNVLVRCINVSGREVFGAVQPHLNGEGQQRNPAVAFLDDGTLAVALEEDRNRDGWYSPLVARLSANGDVVWNKQLG